MLDSHSEPRVVGILSPNIQIGRIQGVGSLGRSSLGGRCGRAFPFPRSLVGDTGSAFVKRCKAAPSHRGKDTPEHKIDAHRCKRHYRAQNGQMDVVCIHFGKIMWHCRARAFWGVLSSSSSDVWSFALVLAKALPSSKRRFLRDSSGTCELLRMAGRQSRADRSPQLIFLSGQWPTKDTCGALRRRFAPLHINLARVRRCGQFAISRLLTVHHEL